MDFRRDDATATNIERLVILSGATASPSEVVAARYPFGLTLTRQEILAALQPPNSPRQCSSAETSRTLTSQR